MMQSWSVLRVSENSPIGEFDSGASSLTIWRAVQEALPHVDLVYVTD